MAGGDRERLTVLLQHKRRHNDWIFVFFPQETKVGVKPIRDIGIRMVRFRFCDDGAFVLTMCSGCAESAFVCFALYARGANCVT